VHFIVRRLVSSDLLLVPSQPERADRCGKLCINLSAVHKTSPGVVIAQEGVLRNAIESTYIFGLSRDDSKRAMAFSLQMA